MRGTNLSPGTSLCGSNLSGKNAWLAEQFVAWLNGGLEQANFYGDVSALVAADSYAGSFPLTA